MYPSRKLSWVYLASLQAGKQVVKSCESESQDAYT